MQFSFHSNHFVDFIICSLTQVSRVANKNGNQVQDSESQGGTFYRILSQQGLFLSICTI